MALSTGDVADQAGVDYQTVLFYEREGLIDEPPRLDNGYRQFPPDTVETIRFIRQAKHLGFTLEESKQLLEIREGRSSGCDRIVSFARKKRKELQKRIDQLQNMESVLADLIEECEERGGYEYCPILETLIEESRSDD